LASRQDKILSGSKWSVVLAAISILTQFASVVVLSRIFTPQEFGFLATTIMVLEFTKTFNFMFLSKAIILEKEDDGKFIGTASSIALLHTAGSLFFLYALWPVLRGFFDNSGFSVYSFAFISLILLLNALYRPLRSVMEKDLRFKEIQKADILIVVGTSIIQISLALLYKQEWVLYTGLALLELGRFIYYLSKSHYNLAWSKKHAEKIYRFSFNIITGDLANKFAVQGDNLVISRYLDAASVGFYSRAYKLMKIPTNLLANVFNQIAFPAFAKSTKEETVSAYLKINYFLAFLTFPIIAVSIIFHQEIVLLLLGPQWAAVAWPFCILSAGIYLRILYKVPISILQANAKFSWLMFTQIVYASCVIVLAYSLKGYGIEGIALGTLIALLINTVVLTSLSSQILHINLKEHLTILVRPIVVFLVTIGYCYLLFNSFLSIGWSSMYAFFVAVGTLLSVLIIAIFLNSKFVLGSTGLWWTRKLGKLSSK